MAKSVIQYFKNKDLFSLVEVKNVLVQSKASGDMEDKWGPTTPR